MHALTGKNLKHIGSRESDACWVVRPAWRLANPRAPIEVAPLMARTAEGVWKEVRKQTKRGRDRFRMADGPLRGQALLQGGAAVP